MHGQRWPIQNGGVRPLGQTLSRRLAGLKEAVPVRPHTESTVFRAVLSFRVATIGRLRSASTVRNYH